MLSVKLNLLNVDLTFTHPSLVATVNTSPYMVIQKLNLAHKKEIKFNVQVYVCQWLCM